MPPVRRCPLEDCLAAKMSIVEPFLNTYFTLSFDLVETPLSQFISLFNAGINVQISSILAIVIEAASFHLLYSSLRYIRSFMNCSMFP